MNVYLLSLLSAAFLSAVVGILAPDGGGGIGKHVRLVSSLLLVCLIAAPLPRLIDTLREQSDQLLHPDGGSQAADPWESRSDEALDAASRSYFARALSEHLASVFSVPSDCITCVIRWESDDGAKPSGVTVLLSGSAIWKDSRAIERYVTDLLGCPCTSAIT